LRPCARVCLIGRATESQGSGTVPGVIQTGFGCLLPNLGISDRKKIGRQIADGRELRLRVGYGPSPRGDERLLAAFADETWRLINWRFRPEAEVPTLRVARLDGGSKVEQTTRGLSVGRTKCSSASRCRQVELSRLAMSNIHESRAHHLLDKALELLTASVAFSSNATRSDASSERRSAYPREAL
jgi:hypothetical protein